MNTTSSSLLERLKQPLAEDAWRRFVNLYTPLLFFWARRLGLQETDAADLVQEVFALLIQKLPGFTYDRQSSFRAWLRTVMQNKWRERQRGKGPAEVPVEPALLDSLPAPDPALDLSEEEFQQRLTTRAMQFMQAEFEPVTWKACWEHVVGGRDAAEVARELGITLNAVYLAKSRVLRRLRQELAGMLD
jgi:RNA polymerase sigma-70 factor (ECF subfamily)